MDDFQPLDDAGMTGTDDMILDMDDGDDFNNNNMQVVDDDFDTESPLPPFSEDDYSQSSEGQYGNSNNNMISRTDDMNMGTSETPNKSAVTGGSFLLCAFVFGAVMYIRKKRRAAARETEFSQAEVDDLELLHYGA